MLELISGLGILEVVLVPTFGAGLSLKIGEIQE